MYNKTRRRWLFVLFAAIAVVVLVTSFGPMHAWSNAAHGPGSFQASQQPHGTAEFDIRENKSGQEKLDKVRGKMGAKQKDSTEETLKKSAVAQERFAAHLPGVRLVMGQALKTPETVMSTQG